MESPFSHLLDTNYVPSKEEILQINDLIIDPVNQIGLLDAEISRLQKVIDDLFSKRNRLSNGVRKHRTLLAPVRRIPEELLQEIFIHCLPTHHNPVMSAKHAPILLGRVCSQWRRVSVSTPRLWSAIHIALTDEPQPWGGWRVHTPTSRGTPEVEGNSGNTHLEAVQMWLSRSGALPLSISLVHSASNTTTDTEEQVVSILLTYASRWRHVALLVSDASYPLLAALSIGAVPLLESFYIHDITNKLPTRLELLPCNAFLAPRLQHASSSHPLMMPKNLNWAQLSSLCLESQGSAADGLTPFIALEILNKCQNLIDCRLEFGWGQTQFGWSQAPSDYDTVVTLPLLRTLAVKEGPATIKPFYDHLHLPSLTNLEFQGSSSRNFDDPSPLYSSLHTLLARLDTLQALTISSYNISEETLLECLRCVPSITRLSILSPPTFSIWSSVGWQDPGALWRACGDEVFTLLTPREGEPLVCPHLKVVECNPGDVSDEVLLKFIQQRTAHSTSSGEESLERVDLIFRRQPEMDILSALSPDTLARTEVKLDYYETWLRRKNHSPWAGLEEPGRLEMVRKPFAKFLHV